LPFAVKMRPFGGYQRVQNRKATPGIKWEDPDWRQPLGLWDEMPIVGVPSHYLARVFASQPMPEQRHGLIVSISFYAG
jgi:hypothetical protein